MGEAYITRRGGSNPLNFKVVVGTTQPASQKEYMIWVNSDVPSTSYIFSATEPEAPAEGENPVWILTGTSSNVMFSVTKKNPITIYPISAKQYVNGVWESKIAKSYQNGKWVDWWLGELYVTGDEFTGITGGWIFRPDDEGGTAIGSKGSSSITVGSSSTYAAARNNATHNNYISLERFTEAKVHIVSAKSGGTSTCVAKMRIMDESGTEKSNVLFFEGQNKSITDQWYSIDVSGLPPGLYKVEIHARHTSSSKQYCYVEFDEVRCV